MAVGTLPELRDKVIIKVGSIGTSQLKPTDDSADQQIDAGVTHYSRISPLRIVHEQDGDGATKRFILDDDLTGWIPSFSAIGAIYDVEDANTDDESVDEIELDDVRFTVTTAGKEVMFLPGTVDSSNTLRVVFTTKHLVHAETAAETTVPDIDEPILITICASYLAFWIARKASELMNVQVGMSEVDYGKLRDSWADRARELLAEASELLKPKVIGAPSAGFAQQWPTDSRLTGRTRISH